MKYLFLITSIIIIETKENINKYLKINTAFIILFF